MKDGFDREPQLNAGCTRFVWFDRDFCVAELEEPRGDYRHVALYRDQPGFPWLMSFLYDEEVNLDAGRFEHFSHAMLPVDCRIDISHLSEIQVMIDICAEMDVPWTLRMRTIRTGGHAVTFMFNSDAEAVMFKLKVS